MDVAMDAAMSSSTAGATPRVIDLNSDMGEGFGPWRMGDDAALLDVVTTANVACGMHAGDPSIMARTCGLAAARGVRVGAHPGLDDLRGFGRRAISGEPVDDLCALVVYQVGALSAIAAREGVSVTHVKLHGALSNSAAVDGELAAALASAIATLDAGLRWLVPSGSAMAEAARGAGLRSVGELFCDRAYDADGDLLPRGQPGAVLDDPAAIASRALEMVERGGVTTAAGGFLSLPVESLCVHGDSATAVDAARGVRARLADAGIGIRAF